MRLAPDGGPPRTEAYQPGSHRFGMDGSGTKFASLARTDHQALIPSFL